MAMGPFNREITLTAAQALDALAAIEEASWLAQDTDRLDLALRLNDAHLMLLDKLTEGSG